MNIFEKLIYLLQATMTTPPSFGLWHFCSVLLLILLSAVTVWRFRNADDRTVRRIVLIAWLIMLCFEVYKQIVFAMDTDGVTATWSYTWYAFPFQFCSLPLYLFPFIVFLKDGKVRDGVIFFSTTYLLFAGLAVMICPNDVYISYIGINIQTMVHHGLQVLIGIYLFTVYHRRLTMRRFPYGFAVFILAVGAAMILNLSVHAALTACGIDATFNMFFISPYYENTLPVLSSLYPHTPYPLFLVVYILGFSLLAAMMYGIQRGILTLSEGKRHEHKS